MSWDPVQADIDGYMLSYSSSEGDSEAIPIGSDSTSYTLTGLKPGVLYAVYVWAFKGSKTTRKISTDAETGANRQNFYLLVTCYFLLKDFGIHEQKNANWGSKHTLNCLEWILKPDK